MEKGAGSPKLMWRRSQAAVLVCETSVKTFALNVSHKNWRERLSETLKYGTLFYLKLVVSSGLPNQSKFL